MYIEMLRHSSLTAVGQVWSPWKCSLVSLRDRERVGLIRPSAPSLRVMRVWDPSSWPEEISKVLNLLKNKEVLVLLMFKYDFKGQCMRKPTIWLLMKYLSFAGGLDSGEVQLTCNEDTLHLIITSHSLVTSSMSPTLHLLTLSPGLAWVPGDRLPSGVSRGGDRGGRIWVKLEIIRWTAEM